VFVGRSDEQSRLAALIDGARRGQSSAVILYGEPGVGKSTLLERVMRRAEGGLVLRAQPLQSESELPFASLSDLLRPILDLRERIPDRQLAALEGALALGPPVAGDRFAVAAATLSLLAAAAEEMPVLVIVDDAHWLDAASRATLIFTGRRLGTEGILLLLAMRDREWLHESGLPAMPLAGLAPDDAAALTDAADDALEPSVRRRVISETRGNPLAILEAVATLTDAERRGQAPIAHPLAVGPALERAFADQLEDLPARTRVSLLVAAASDTGAADEIIAGLREAGIDPLALEPAERAGVVTVGGGRIAFRHPLVRSAAYHAHDPAARRSAHRALAAAVGGGDRAAWHLAAAAAGPDEDVAGALEASGMGALTRSAYGAAASALEAAVVLSPRDEEKVRRAIGAGRALWLNGESRRAAAILQNALQWTSDPSTRASLQHLRGLAMFFTFPVSETLSTLIAEADRVERDVPLQAAQLLATASNACVMGADLRRAEDIAERASRLVAADRGRAGLMVQLTLGSVLALRGRVADGLQLIDAVFDTADRSELLDPSTELASAMFAVLPVLTWTDRWEQSRPLLEAIIGMARSAGAATGLPFWLSALSELELRSGRIAAAFAAAAESVQLAEDTGQATELTYSRVTLARVDAILGHDDECRALVRTALADSRRTGASSIEDYASSVLGLLELGRGHLDQALGHLRECPRLYERHGTGLLGVVQWAGDLLEAQVRGDEADGARHTLALVEANAQRTNVRWEQAMAARGRGMLAPDASFETEFARALEIHGDDAHFERARTLLALGMRRRRARRRAAARDALHEALGYFDSAGAEPWAEQARIELRATGEAPAARHAADGSLRALTPQELQVSLTVAGGATNREAAAALFLSTKTVEFHLSNTYRKLGLRSRAELVRRVEGLA
jgi:DNA-binding CsgD family transcriptional regulator